MDVANIVTVRPALSRTITPRGMVAADGPPDSSDSPETKRPSSDDLDAPSSVLVVDDEPLVARALGRMLRAEGFEVVYAASGDEGVQALTSRSFCAVFSDINMPGMSGLDLLRVARAYDMDLGIVLMTGRPDTESAIQAVELGALCYLRKPFDSDEIRRVARRAVEAGRSARRRREALRFLADRQKDQENQEWLGAALDRALATLTLAFQPIVETSSRTAIAHEALMRSAEAALPNPGAVLDAATQLGRLVEVGRRVRELVAERIAELPPGTDVFVNLHPDDLRDPELADPKSPLGRFADRVVLEITERASLEEIPDLQARVSVLKFLGYRLAIDDLGTGYAGLGALPIIEPDFVKLDMSLIRNVHESRSKRTMIRALTALCEELGSVAIAEGIETVEEYDTLRRLGCDVMQGYLFARPASPPLRPTFPPRT